LLIELVVIFLFTLAFLIFSIRLIFIYLLFDFFLAQLLFKLHFKELLLKNNILNLLSIVLRIVFIPIGLIIGEFIQSNQKLVVLIRESVQLKEGAYQSLVVAFNVTLL
jgi:hypothetical protein